MDFVVPELIIELCWDKIDYFNLNLGKNWILCNQVRFGTAMKLVMNYKSTLSAWLINGLKLVQTAKPGSSWFTNKSSSLFTRLIW